MRVFLKNVRATFTNSLVFPQAFEGQPNSKPTHNCQFLIEPDSDNHKALKAAMAETATAKWAAKGAGILKGLENSKRCLKDVDAFTYNGYEGMASVSASRDPKDGAPKLYTRRPPKVNGEFVPDVTTDGVIYSGCYVNATLDIWAQDNKFGKALRATLINVQFIADGENLGGTAVATSEGVMEFEDDDLVSDDEI